MTSRALPVLALLAPLAASGLDTGQAELLPDTGNADVNYVGLAMCQGGTATLNWTLNLGSNPFAANGTYRIQVSDDAPISTGTDAGSCPASVTGTTTTTTLEDGIAATSSSASQELQTGELAPGAGLDCDATKADRSMYLCVEWLNSGGTRGGFANVKVTLQLRPPPAPVNVRVTPNEDALDVAWSAGTQGAGQAPSWEYEAVATDGTVTRRKRVSGTSVTIDGLHNGTAYDVVVYAYSRGDNRSAESEHKSGTPVPVDDFWEHYRNSGGTDSGGCASGPAGLGALAGLALARAVRRRRA